MSFASFPNDPGLSGAPLGTQRAVTSTPPAGTPLVNGTPTLLSWAAPNDGALHYVSLAFGQNVTVAETGGGVNVNWTLNGVGRTTALAGANLGVGFTANLYALICDPGTTVSVVQLNALTVGAASFLGVLTADHA